MKSRILGALVVGVIAVGLAGLVGCSSQSEATIAEVKLPTLVCESCSQTIKTALKKVDGVENVEMDLKTKTAKVTFAAKVTNVPALEQAVVGAGYAANDKKADPEAYAKLAECCKADGH
jgi:mercuric ion binding protein